MVAGESTKECELLVIGGGPGGYSAAFRAAELGVKTVLIEEKPYLGGVCLNAGCIPSKALLATAELIHNAERAKEFGVAFSVPDLDIDKLRSWKNSILDRLRGGLDTLCKKYKVERVRGRAAFADSHTVRVQDGEVGGIKYEHAIMATGSRPITLRGLQIDSPRVLDSTGALALQDVPETFLVIGGGYIGLEMGTVYAALGSKVTVVEMMDSLLPGVDGNLVRPLHRALAERFDAICLKTKVVSMKETDAGLELAFEGEQVPETTTYQRVLVSVGRRPNTEDLGLENTKVTLDERKFVQIDDQFRTSDERIRAIGDVAGEPMLAHKAIREGKVCAEIIAGKPSTFDSTVIPAVVFTDPEVAWCGLTETQAKSEDIPYKVGRLPWSASGRAATLNRSDGMTKILFEPETNRVLGVGIVGPHAGDLIAEGVLAIEMGAKVGDLTRAIHAHPTLSETFPEAAEAFLAKLGTGK